MGYHVGRRTRVRGGHARSSAEPRWAAAAAPSRCDGATVAGVCAAAYNAKRPRGDVRCGTHVSSLLCPGGRDAGAVMGP